MSYSWGLDLGNCIVGRRQKNEGSFESMPIDGMFDILPKLVKRFSNTYIISRVNSEQRERSLLWLEKYDFFNRTGIDKNNLYYCFERRDKALFVKALNIRIFIDDRPNVLTPMGDDVRKILFNPTESDMVKHCDEIKNAKNLVIVRNWKEIEEYLC